jgi:hypothetical protein
MRIRLYCALAVVAWFSQACSRKAPDMTPEGLVREFLDRVERAEGDPAQARAVYELLSDRTKAGLAERARRASAAGSRNVMPEEMLAPARFSLRFEPLKMRAHVADTRAVVDVVGIDPDIDHAEVPCLLEHGRWRIEIPLPPLAPAERRPESEH